jgi:hypothetical protein
MAEMLNVGWTIHRQKALGGQSITLLKLLSQVGWTMHHHDDSSAKTSSTETPSSCEQGRSSISQWNKQVVNMPDSTMQHGYT